MSYTLYSALFVPNQGISKYCIFLQMRAIYLRIGCKFQFLILYLCASGSSIKPPSATTYLRMASGGEAPAPQSDTMTSSSPPGVDIDAIASAMMKRRGKKNNLKVFSQKSQMYFLFDSDVSSSPIFNRSSSSSSSNLTKPLNRLGGVFSGAAANLRSKFNPLSSSNSSSNSLTLLSDLGSGRSGEQAPTSIPITVPGATAGGSQANGEGAGNFAYGKIRVTVGYVF